MRIQTLKRGLVTCLIAAALCLGVSRVASSQTTQTVTVTWTTGDTPALIAGWTHTLKVDAATPVAVPSPTCTAVPLPATGSSCTAQAAIPTLTSGSHTFILTATGGLGSASSSPFVSGTPGRPTITIITIIQVP